MVFFNMAVEVSDTDTSEGQWSGMDRWEGKRLSEALLSSQMRSVACVSHVAGELATVGGLLAARLLSGAGRLIFCGAGSAGAQACLDGIELPGTFGWPKHRLALLLAGGIESFFDQGGLCEDSIELAIADLQALDIGEADVLVAVSASGNTPYTIAAVEHAGDRGALTLALVNSQNSQLQAKAKLSLVLETGPEVIAGSTRMAAATAQKIALNALSTLIMTRLGYVYDNLMVQMQVSNKKLQARAVAIVCQISGCGAHQAELYLGQSEQKIPLAVLLAKGVPRKIALQKLNDSDGKLRDAMES